MADQRSGKGKRTGGNRFITIEDGRDNMKKILLITVFMIIGFSSVANAQCKIVPQGGFLFADDLSKDSIFITGTWMSIEKSYDPRNPNTSTLSCDRQKYECRVTTAYIVSGLLDLWEKEYRVTVWNSEHIVTVGFPWLNKQSNQGRPVLTIKRSDKSVIEDNSSLVGILIHNNLPKSRRMGLKEGNPLYNKSLKKYYGM